MTKTEAIEKMTEWMNEASEHRIKTIYVFVQALLRKPLE